MISRSLTRFSTIGLLLLIAIGSGCRSYSLRSPYDRSIETVYVPIFQSDSFREGINLELTRAVQEEIRKRTPYRVVTNPNEADTILSGTVLYANKNVRVVTPNNLPREIFGEITVEVSWEDIRGGVNPDEPPATVRVTQSTPFYKEIGETSTIAYDRVVAQLARDIVNMMEARW